MSRVEVLTHQGKPVILVDLSHCPPEETLKILPTAKAVVARSAPKTARVLTDVTGAAYTKDVAAAIKDFSDNNTPYIKASAVVGAEGIQLILLQTVSLLTRREIKTCKTRAEALTWLASL